MVVGITKGCVKSEFVSWVGGESSDSALETLPPKHQLFLRENSKQRLTNQ